MSIAPRMRQVLERLRVDYELIAHEPTGSALEAAHLCHIPPDRVVKAVLLDTDNGYLLAALPADRRVDLDMLRGSHGEKPLVAEEAELALVFYDCEVGAVPPFGSSYGIPTIIEEQIDAQPDLYFEAGDHASLVHISRAEFTRLTRNAQHGRFRDTSMDQANAPLWGINLALFS